MASNSRFRRFFRSRFRSALKTPRICRLSSSLTIFFSSPHFDLFAPKSNRYSYVFYIVFTVILAYYRVTLPISCRLLVCTMCEGRHCRSPGVRTWVPIASEI